MSLSLPLKPVFGFVVCLIGLMFVQTCAAQRPRKLPKPGAYRPRKAPPRIKLVPKKPVVQNPAVPGVVPQNPAVPSTVPQNPLPQNPVPQNAVPLTSNPTSGSGSIQPVPDSETAPTQNLPVKNSIIADPSASISPVQNIGSTLISDLKPSVTNSALINSVSEVAVAATEPKPLEPSPYDFTIEPAHQSLIFGVSHFGYSYTYGRFNKVSGGFTFAKNDPTSGEFEFEIDVNSIDTNDKKRDGHLLGPDFFDAAQYPAIKFKSLRVDQAKDKMLISGLLTMHGKTKQVRIPMQHVGEGNGPDGKYRSGFNSQFVIRRSDFGMKTMLPKVGDEISITFSFEGIKSDKLSVAPTSAGTR